MSADDGAAEQSILRLRFPDGDVEIRWSAIELPVGVIVRSRGVLWVVKSSNNGSVVLEPASANGPGGVPGKPDAINDDIFLELTTV